MRFGGPIYGFDVEQYISKKEAKEDGCLHPLRHCRGVQALKDSGIEITKPNSKRIRRGDRFGHRW